MPNILDIAALNPVPFYWQGYTQPANYLTKFMEDYEYKERIKDFEEPAIYYRKWMDEDIIKLQLSANFGPIQIDVINCYEQVVTTITPSPATTSIISQPFSFYNTNIPVNGLDDGYFYLRIKAGSGGSIEYYNSPAMVKGVFPNTILLKYSHEENEYDVAFDSGIQFQFRVEGGLTAFTPKIKNKVYDDQNLNLVRLSSTPFKSETLVIGGPEGVPDDVADLVNRIFACDTVLIDGKQYVRPEGASMEAKREEFYPMAGWSFEVREAQNRNSKRHQAPIDPNRRVSVVYNINTKLFGDLNGLPSNSEVQIIETE